MRANPDDFPELMDSAMVAELLGYNVATVRRLVREGTLPAYRLPNTRTYQFFKSEILEWVRKHPAVERPGAGEQGPDR